MSRIFMILEFVENGQIMYYDNRTQTFKSERTSRYFPFRISVDGVLSEDIAKRYLYDIVAGLKYC